MKPYTPSLSMLSWVIFHLLRASAVSGEDVTLYHMMLTDQQFPPSATFEPGLTLTPVSVDKAGVTYYEGAPKPLGNPVVVPSVGSSTTVFQTSTESPTATLYYAVQADKTKVVRVIATAPSVSNPNNLYDKSDCELQSGDVMVCVNVNVVDGFGEKATYTFTQTGKKYPWITISNVEQFNIARPTDAAQGAKSGSQSVMLKGPSLLILCTGLLSIAVSMVGG